MLAFTRISSLNSSQHDTLWKNLFSNTTICTQFSMQCNFCVVCQLLCSKLVCNYTVGATEISCMRYTVFARIDATPHLVPALELMLHLTKSWYHDRQGHSCKCKIRTAWRTGNGCCHGCSQNLPPKRSPHSIVDDNAVETERFAHLVCHVLCTTSNGSRPWIDAGPEIIVASSKYGTVCISACSRQSLARVNILLFYRH